MADYKAQVCVIAAGPSGLAAAVQAAENGASVVVLEKNAAVGGAANMGMGPLGIGTKYQKKDMRDLTVEKALNMMMEYTHYNVDARLIRRYFGMSADTIQWLEDLGVEFEGAFPYFPKSEATWHIVKTDHGIGPRAASFMNKALYAKALEYGVTFLMETPGKKILKKDGKVCGVVAVDKTGKEITIECEAAIIATGGAGCNPEMIKEETGYIFGEDMYNFAIPGIVGDGLKMAWEAGSDKLPVRIEQAASCVGVEGLSGSVTNIMTQPNLLVNLHGKRIMNEEQMQNTTYLSNAVSHQKKRSGYSIVDSSIVRYYMKNGVDVTSLVRPNPDVSDFKDSVKAAQEAGIGELFVADTIEELADQIGINKENLVKTVEDYNAYCESGDDEFFKPKKFMRPIFRPPFYAARIAPGGYGTVGGIRINENCEVCDKEFEPIPGLYAVGADACNFYDDSYMFLLCGNSMGWAVNSGRIAGMQSAEYISK
ncbi:MAG: FAD-dependent oxidoreductase [Eubacteriales bacterium]|nr:FAD-dependent oxidoreductase [Eubacteriales bacterium]